MVVCVAVCPAVCVAVWRYDHHPPPGVTFIKADLNYSTSIKLLHANVAPCWCCGNNVCVSRFTEITYCIITPPQLHLSPSVHQTEPSISPHPDSLMSRTSYQFMLLHVGNEEVACRGGGGASGSRSRGLWPYYTAGLCRDSVPVAER